jgi:hypothetical protein
MSMQTPQGRSRWRWTTSDLKYCSTGYGEAPQDRNDGGHNMYTPNGHSVTLQDRRSGLPEVLAFPDGTYCRGEPKKDDRLQRKTLPETEGICRINFIEGWTILSFWDRSGSDTRPGCNSNFLVYGRRSFKEMVALANKNYPRQAVRRAFGLVLEGMDITPSTVCVFCEADKAESPGVVAWRVNDFLCCSVHLPELLKRDGTENTVVAVS